MRKHKWAPGRLIDDRNQMQRLTIPQCGLCDWVGLKCNPNDGNDKLWAHVDAEHSEEEVEKFYVYDF